MYEYRKPHKDMFDLITFNIIRMKYYFIFCTLNMSFFVNLEVGKYNALYNTLPFEKVSTVTKCIENPKILREKLTTYVTHSKKDGLKRQALPNFIYAVIQSNPCHSGIYGITCKLSRYKKWKFF